ncbi:MAG: response regulator [Deltaproteobacteria bacterium]|nr:response regulator [Candidatus Zymogenaceae bacterium]
MKKTILVVDDDQDLREQLRINLEAAGYRVDTADGVTTASEYLAEKNPDIAIVDLMLEHVDSGFSLCYHIKKKKPELPIIMISAVVTETGFSFDAATDEERSWVRADVFLNKPVRTEQLLYEIERLLEQK